MQLLNSPQTQQESGLTGQLLDVLQDIVRKIEIKSDFSIHHPDYKPLELPSEAVERFQKMPTQMQQKYLSLQLRSFLYGIYYNGSMRSALALDGEGNGLSLDLENNTFLGVDVGFYKQLHESNFGEGYFDPGWSVLREERDRSLAVTKGGLRLHIQRNKHLQPAEVAAVVGDSVAIKMPKNRVQNGFYMAVSNAGFNYIEDVKILPVTIRIYINVTPEGAVAMMGSLTQRLNDLAIPFSFKVLYNPKEYQRYDSGVLYFDKRDYEVVRQVLKTFYQEHQLHFKPEIPLFTKQLALGLGLAEEPDQKFAIQESFGMNRCQIVANGLLEAWYQGDESIEERMQSILGQFFHLGIDLQRPYVNANSEDIY
ncbi:MULTISPECIES: T3SS effector HopA1 family protein [unclassified Nostoc]|uniref:T3SS effector HopA1 family protein n=1 Tax=unclassified Nostoc TaxID=2593658 RepID=UPI002AD2D185|nr:MULTISPECIES: T3SS effector HopA1 family protein [unclassified Nostoc]MDZ8126264.1 T3SS effector HopA1 family protein [Nostoc sp. CmiVER01]MDZ8227298.1 T3SS effector HopA1 family protein [Nostoc sp. ChiVER01]